MNIEYVPAFQRRASSNAQPRSGKREAPLSLTMLFFSVVTSVLCEQIANEGRFDGLNDSAPGAELNALFRDDLKTRAS